MSKVWVGIDAGGTQVRVRWAGGELHGAGGELRGASAPDGGPEPAMALLQQVPGDVVSVCAGITKISRGDTKERWERALTQCCPAASISVVPDYVVAFHGAIPEGAGILCVSGTGSVIYGENAQGNAVRVGGRGWEFGDEGSGASVTTEAMRRTLRACDGLWPHTALTMAICEALATHDAALVGERARQRALTEGRGFLVQLIREKALMGDKEAVGLFTGAAGWLARYVRAAHEQLDFPAGSTVPVALVGGMWEQVGEWMQAPFCLLLKRWEIAVTPLNQTGSPVEGALHLAERSVAVTR